MPHGVHLASRDMPHVAGLYKLSHLCTPLSQEFGDAPVLRDSTGVSYGLFIEPCSSPVAAAHAHLSPFSFFPLLAKLSSRVDPFNY